MRLFGFEIKRPGEAEAEPVSFAPPQEDDGAVVVAAGGVYGTYVDLEGSAKTEAELVTKYRDMMNHPEVDSAVDDIVNEAIVYDLNEPIVKIDFNKVELPDNIKKIVEGEFNNVLKFVFTSGFDPYDFKVLIYNRWGEIIFETYDTTSYWDGTYDNKPCPSGSYTYFIQFGDKNTERKYSVAGNVNLIR